MKRTLVATIAMMLLISAGNAMADTLTIGWTDSVTHWSGWGNGTSWYYQEKEDLIDSIGEPQITGGTILIRDGVLQAITMNYLKDPGWMSFDPGNPSPGQMLPGDLFWDNNGDGAWDYVLSFYNGRSNSDPVNKFKNTTSFASAPIYALNDFHYLTTDDSENLSVNGVNGYWYGLDVRNNHPFAATDISGNIAGTGSLVFGSGSEFNTLTFDLSGARIQVGGAYGFGFTPNCANEVILVATPEPSSMILLGSGLLMAIGAFRKNYRG
jgi:hypothetical protein